MISFFLFTIQGSQFPVFGMWQVLQARYICFGKQTTQGNSFVSKSTTLVQLMFCFSDTLFFSTLLTSVIRTPLLWLFKRVQVSWAQAHFLTHICFCCHTGRGWFLFLNNTKGCMKWAGTRFRTTFLLCQLLGLVTAQLSFTGNFNHFGHKIMLRAFSVYISLKCVEQPMFPWLCVYLFG